MRLAIQLSEKPTRPTTITPNSTRSIQKCSRPTLGGEYLLVSGEGIANTMVDGREHFWMDLVLFGVIVVGLVGFALNWIASRIEARALAWRGRSVAQF